MSKAKGNSYENRILRQIREVWPDAYKTLGSGNANDDKGDIVWKEFCIECKHHKTLSRGELEKFWLKIREEASRMNKTPLLVYRENRKPDMVMFWKQDMRVIAYWDEFIEVHR